MSSLAARIGFSLAAGVLFSATACASLYINTPSGYQRMGGPAREGPFATRAQAEAFLRANFPTWSTSNIVGSEDAQPAQTQVDNSAAAREAEERAAAEKKAAEEQATKDKAAREAENAGRFQKIREDATKQLKGFNPDNDLKLKGISGGGTSGLKEAPRPTTTAVYSDAMVVDARHVPSGLRQGMDSAITTAYSAAPPGVSDRVRKGFQAVMDRDWKVAKAWFEDALNRDPDNAALRRLVALADTSVQPKQPSAMGPPPSSAKPPRFAPGTDIQLPDPDDIYFLFPGLKALEEKQMMEMLFGLDTPPPSQKPVEPKAANVQGMPLPPKAVIKPNWGAFFDALFKTPPKRNYPAVNAIRG